MGHSAATSPSPPATTGVGSRPGSRRHRHAATAGVISVVIAVSGFALWGSASTASVGRTAVAANRLSDHYQALARAVAAEESLERKYRLEPGPEVRARFDAAAADFVTGLRAVAADGSDADRATASRLLTAHVDYLRAIDAMFAAVDRGDHAESLRIDGAEVDPRFGEIEQQVLQDARIHHDAAIVALERLRMLIRFTSVATPVIVVGGLLLIGVFLTILRRVRRRLDRQRERLVHSSLHDDLTGLPNRTLVTDRLEQALRAARRGETRTGLLLLDLDRFKQVNETFGHERGDDLLRQIGPRLATALREVDTVGRLSGDEFAVLLPEVDGVEGAQVVAHRLRSALAEPFTVAGVELSVEASFGVAVAGTHGEDAMTLMQSAEITMYLAKKHNLGVCSTISELDRSSPGGLALLGQLRRGLERSELVLHYQPKINLRTGLVCGAEALVRWEHPERGLVPPNEFIPLAEHTGLIAPLTRSVLETAMRQIVRWRQDGVELPVAVNLSARNLVDEHLFDEIAALLERYRIDPRLLELEVTETAITTEPVRAAQLLGRLHELGVRLAIDDFGAGYTSLAQLRALPITDLKVDRSFVTTMDRDPSNSLIVHSVVELGHNLGLTATAEGVETAQALTSLADYGCDTAQGYHICRPLPPDAFQSWLHRWDPAAVRAATGADTFS